MKFTITQEHIDRAKEFRNANPKADFEIYCQNCPIAQCIGAKTHGLAVFHGYIGTDFHNRLVNNSPEMNKLVADFDAERAVEPGLEFHLSAEIFIN